MDDETNLSSKLPVADRTREVWGRTLCWWCLSYGFPLCTFLLGFADSFCFVFISSPPYESSPLCSILCNLFTWLCWYVEVFKKGFWGVRPSIASSDHHGSVFQLVVLHRGFSSANVHQATWPVHLNCANFRRVCTVCIPALFRTSVSGILSCHFRSFQRQLLACRW